MRKIVRLVLTMIMICSLTVNVFAQPVTINANQPCEEISSSDVVAEDYKSITIKNQVDTSYLSLYRDFTSKNNEKMSTEGYIKFMNSLGIDVEVTRKYYAKTDFRENPTKLSDKTYVLVSEISAINKLPSVGPLVAYDYIYTETVPRVKATMVIDRKNNKYSDLAGKTLFILASITSIINHGLLP